MIANDFRSTICRDTAEAATTAGTSSPERLSPRRLALLGVCLAVVIGVFSGSLAGPAKATGTPAGVAAGSIAAGVYHSCGIKTNGKVDCWGNDNYGQSTDPAGTFTQIAAGGVHSCGIRSDGTVACWGDNGDGQSTEPAGTFTQIAAGGDHNCGIKSEGTVDCWGSNDSGQSTAPAGTFTRIAAGDSHNCGIKTDGTVACWGSDNFGQATDPAGTFTQVAAGHLHSCGIKTDGTVDCWGDDSYGQSTDPTGTFTQIAAGSFHNCGIKTDGTVDCWGENDGGPLDFGQATDPAGTFTQVAAGYFHSCGIKTDGTVDCWGVSDGGPSDNGQATPPTGTFAGSAIAAGYYHSCGIKTDGTADCWGDNGSGQSTAPAGAFTRIAAGGDHNCGIKSEGTVDCWGSNDSGQSTAPAGTFTQIAAGNQHSCGIKTDGTANCWGDDSSGQSTAPAGTFTRIAAGYAHSCGIKTDGTVDCWGDNGSGQSTAPAGTFTQIAAGNYHNCGINTDGTVDCWGSDNFGQSTEPAGAFTRIAAGGVHSCGIKSDGTADCWGDDSYGQSTDPAGTFTKIAAGLVHSCGIKTDGKVDCWGFNGDGRAPPGPSITAGGKHSCGIKSDGTVACWGVNDGGPYDNGQTTPPAGTFTQVAAGDIHSCGIKADETLACWGSNSDNRATPPTFKFRQISAGYTHNCGVRSTGTPGAIACWGDSGSAGTPPAGTFTQVAAGYAHSCAAKTDKTLACWGYDGDGRATPPGGTFTQVAAGFLHSCAVKTDKTLACWGYNGDGRTSPPGGSFTEVAAGEAHNCALRTNGTIACWGLNGDGQASPPAGSFTQVAAGSFHSCAVKSDGTFVCWGKNADGQAAAPDFVAPDPPSYSRTVPRSPANDNNPKIKGSAEAGSTVRLYTTSDCSGTEAGSGSAATYTDPGIATTVADDTTTAFYATATDAAGNTSDCDSQPLTYVEDSTAPDTTIDSGPSGTIATDHASFTFSGTPAGDTAKVQCKIDAGAFADCSSPKSFTGLSEGPHTASFRAEDAAGNQDQSPATRTFTVDAASPANDNFASAQVLTGLPVSTAGTNVNATREGGEPDHNGSGSGHSVWYSWTAPSSGVVTVDLSGSDFDTYLAVYTGSALGSLSLVDDDDDGGSAFTSKLSFSATSGVTYWIAVEGFGGDTGSVELAVYPSQPGSISGTVTDASSNPLENICVNAYDSSDINAGFAFTDASGNYAIDGLETGDYRLNFLDCGSNNVITEFYNDKSTLAAADPVSVTVGSDTPGIDAELAEGGSISGTVTDASSNPLENICVDAYDTNGDFAGFRSTDASGNYAIGGLGAGDHRLHFYDCGSNNVITEFYNDKSTLAAADPVSVTVGSDTSGIDAELARGVGSISGTVTDASSNPLEDICVDAYDSNGDFAGFRSTDASGNYAIGGLEAGDYRLRFNDCGSNYVLDEYYNDKSTLAAADPVSVTAGSDASGIDAQLAGAGSISGTVTDASSNPLEDICVNAFDSGGAIAQFSRTDASGNYAIDGLEAVAYRVGFYDCVSNRVLDEYYNDKSTLAAADPVSVTVGSDTSGIDAELVPIQHTLSIASSGTGQGTITSSPAGISCGANCSQAFDDGTLVTLTANPSAGSTFTGWSGAGCSGTGTCQVTIASDQTATATFTANPAPPDTTIDSGPSGTIATDHASFTFSGTPAGDTAKVQCKIDAGAFADCSSPKSFTGLSEGPHTASFRAEDAAGNQDPTPATRTFTVDTTPPDTTIDSGPSGTIATDQATFTFSGTPAGDTAKVQCKIDAGAFADCSSPKSFTGLSEGPHTASFRAEDAAGNQDPTPATRTFAVDTTPPDTTIDSGPSGTIATDQASFTFSGSPAGDTAKVQCKIDPGAFADCSSPKSFTGLSEGPHTASFRAEDAAGNQDPTPATRTFAVDTTPPDTTIDSGPSGTIATDQASFTFSGSPAGDTAKVQCKIDPGAFADCSSPKSFTGLSEGPHTASFRAEDAAGNQDPTPATRAFTVDTSVDPPVVDPPVVDPPVDPPAGKAVVGKVKVGGPAKVKKGKKATYKLSISNSGNADATDVRLQVKGKGVKAKKSVGTITAGKAKTVKVMLKPKKPGKIKVSFKVTSENAGGKTAKKKIKVKK